jgi:hypothetical protein
MFNWIWTVKKYRRYSFDDDVSCSSNLMMLRGQLMNKRDNQQICFNSYFILVLCFEDIDVLVSNPLTCQ